MSPYGRSKLMTEWMLADVAAAHPLTYGVLRYFNVAGADPQGAHRPVDAARHAPDQGRRAGGAGAAAAASTSSAPTIPTPDGTGVRDYIHVTDLVEAHALLLDHLRGGGAAADAELRLRPGLSRCAQVIDTVKAVSGVDFTVDRGAAPRRRSGLGRRHRPTRCAQLLGWKPAHDDLTEIVTAAPMSGNAIWPHGTASVSPHRRRSVMISTALSIGLFLALASPAFAQPVESFDVLHHEFRGDGGRRGRHAEIYAQATYGLTPDPNVPDLVTTQPEFTTPMWDYIDKRVTEWRIGKGKAAIGRAPGAVRCGRREVRRRSLPPRRDLGHRDRLRRECSATPS